MGCNHFNIQIAFTEPLFCLCVCFIKSPMNLIYFGDLLMLSNNPLYVSLVQTRQEELHFPPYTQTN